MAMREKTARRSGGITFHHPGAFWFGISAATVGTLLTLPEYWAARHTCKMVPVTVPGSPLVKQCYVLAGKGVDGAMAFGMALMLIGIAATFYGLFPRLSEVSKGYISRIRVRAMDDAPLKPAHVALLLVMAVAVTIDIMKPTQLSFVVPGMAKEYGLKTPANVLASGPRVAWLPLSGITGTVLGSFIWGFLGDRIGRRASILLAALLFIVTSACGAMPNYNWNFAMCFIMGIGVGGMLPIAFALLSETIPARHRGWLMVLIGGDVAGAYIITSTLATAYIPTYSWRIMWLIGIPTGVLLIALNYFIPESPRFLLANGRDEEARAVMERYGAQVVEADLTEFKQVEERVRSRFAQLFERPFGGLSGALILFALALGFITFGFQLWLPTNLTKLLAAKGLTNTEVTSDRILRNASLIGFPATFVVAWLYGFWSSKKTMILLAVLTAVTLGLFIVKGNSLASHISLLKFYLVLLLIGVSSVAAVIVPYSSEVYPTRIRSRGTGLLAGATKAGGVLVIALVVFGIAIPSIRITAIWGGVTMALAAVAVAAYGIETRQKRLEQITAEELDHAEPQTQAPTSVR
ncbi:MAG TPA: MFS transporter [Actinomycetota bacterium]